MLVKWNETRIWEREVGIVQLGTLTPVPQVLCLQRAQKGLQN